MKRIENLRRQGAAIVTAAVLLLGTTASAFAAEKDAYVDRVSLIEEMVGLNGEEGPLRVHLDSFQLPVEYVAQFHAAPAKRYQGPTLNEKAAAARLAVANVGRLVDSMRADVVAGDKPNEYVVNEADKALSKLSEGYNELLVPGVQKLDNIENRMKVIAGILYVVAPSNNAAANAQAAAESKIAKEDGELSEELADAQEKRQQVARGENGIVGEDSNVIHPKTAGTAAEIEKQAKSELRLTYEGQRQLNALKKEARDMVGLLSNMAKVMRDVDAIKDSLTRNDAAYRKGVDGSAVSAQKSARALEVAIDSVGEFTTLAMDFSGRTRGMADGPFGESVAAVLRCSQENLRMAQTLQGQGEFQVKSDAIKVALAKNLAAVRSIEAMSPGFYELMDRKGGELNTLGGMAGRSFNSIAAPEAGVSQDVDGTKALKHTVEGGTELLRR